MEGSGGSLRDAQRLDAVIGRARARDLTADDLDEGDELRGVGRAEPIEEMRPGGPRLGRDAGLDRADRCPRPEPDADRILRAEQLGPDVVAERIVASDLDDAAR